MPKADSNGRRPLPAHIQAQLASAGRETDTGGQPWKGRNLGEGTSHTHQFKGDDGTTDTQLAETWEQWTRGEASEIDMIDALRNVRVFAPVVAQLSQAHITEDGLVSDKESDMALVAIQAPDGRKALPIFTNVDYLTTWHPEARPVAADMRKTALSAVEDDNQLIVINPGQEPVFVARRPAFWAIAKGEEWMPSYSDPAVQAELERIISDFPAITGIYAERGDGVNTTFRGKPVDGGGHGPELKIVLKLIPGLNREQLGQVLGAFQQQLAASSVISEKVDSVQIKLS